jgi:hypothetical protein
MIAILGISIAFIVCYNFNQSKNFESFRDTALLTHKVFNYSDGSYQCNCKCQLACPHNTSTDTSSKTNVSSNQKGYRVNHYPWFVYF